MPFVFEVGSEQWEVDVLDWFPDGDWQTCVYVAPWSLDFDPEDVYAMMFPCGRRRLVTSVDQGGCIHEDGERIVIVLNHPPSSLDEVLEG